MNVNERKIIAMSTGTEANMNTPPIHFTFASRMYLPPMTLTCSTFGLRPESSSYRAFSESSSIRIEERREWELALDYS